jgi:tRNA(Ile)-lysidine synthetase-like protein
MELSTLNVGERAAFRDAAIALSDRLATMQDVILDGLRRLETDCPGHLPGVQLEEWPAWIQRWILTEWLNRQVPALPRRRAITEEVLALSESQAGRKAVFENATVWRERDGWYITTGSEYADSGVEAVSIRIPDEGDNSQYAVGAHMLDLSRLSVTEAEKILHFLRQQNERSILLMDLSSLSGQLQLRAWREGDRFHPLGLGGSKKVKSFLTDRKVRVSTRSAISVLTDDRGILCVLGHAQDERSRITSDTKDVLQLTWHASAMGND